MTDTDRIVTTYISPGTHARRLDIRGTLDKSRASKYFVDNPAHLVAYFPWGIAMRFIAGVIAGCFGPPGECISHWREPSVEERGVYKEHLSLTIPPLPMEAFCALLGMAQYAAGSETGLVFFQVIEEDVVRVEAVDLHAIERFAAPTVRFPLVFPSCPDDTGVDQSFKDARVVVTFAAPVSEETHKRIAESLKAWVALLCGGFPAKRTPMTAGFFVDVSRHLPNEVVLEVEQLYGSKPAWDALLRALDVIDRELQPIERVEAY